MIGDPEYKAIAEIRLPASPDEQSPVAYTWQDVIYAVDIVAIRTCIARQNILDGARFLRFYNEGVRNEKYGGIPIDARVLDTASRAQLLDLLKMDSSALAVLARQEQAQSERQAADADASNRLANGSLVGVHGAPGAAAPPPTRGIRGSST